MVSPMRQLLKHPEFSQGMRDMSSVAPGLAAWGMMTGVAMIKSGMSLVEAVSKMRGKKGTDVTLSIYRDGFEKIKEVPITRDVDDPMTNASNLPLRTMDGKAKR